jgi:RNA polymerase sigma-70 factor (ECF subfamily)
VNGPKRRETLVDHERKSWHLPDDHAGGDFEAFVKDNLSFLESVARRYVGFRGLPNVVAADVVQEALSVAWQAWITKLASVDCGGRRAFVCATMSNMAWEEHRKGRRAGQVTDPSALVELAGSYAGHEDDVLARVALRVLPHAMATLSEQERLILDLAIAGLSHTQIGEQVGLTATNVGTKLYRARERLRHSIGPDLLADLGLGRDRKSPGGAA